MLQTFIQSLKDYYQMFTIGAGVFALAWWLRDTKDGLFARLDKITDNHLAHIESATQKTADSLVELNEQLGEHDARTQAFQDELRSRMHG